jgi:hypothetical protein
MARVGRWAFVVVLVGCSGRQESTDTVASSESQCIAQYSMENGYGAPGDTPVCTSPPPPATELICEPATPESVSLECAAAGVTCDPSAFITREAAECIARLAGMEPGIEPWIADLLYAGDLRHPVWVLENVTYRDPSFACSERGQWLRIDALTGDSEPILEWTLAC